MEIGIVAQRGNERATELAGEIRGELASMDVSVLLDEETGAELRTGGGPVEVMADCPLVVSIGGDGTFLYVARRVGSTPVMGVNLGEVGFLNAVSPIEATDRVIEEVERIRDAGAPRSREVPRLVASGEGWSLPPALNEVVVQGPQRGRGQGLDAEVRIDGSPYTATHADGVIVATPTGSTAYNLSEGGPLVHPDVDAMVVTGMCPKDGMPPLVVGPASEVVVTASGADRAVVASDGDRRWVEAPIEVCIGLADEPVRIAGPRSAFFEALRKLDRGGPGNGKA